MGETRRQLTIGEAEFALRRGRDVEIFLGGCGTSEQPGVRFAVLSGALQDSRLSVFEVRQHGPDFLDLYEAGPLAVDSEDQDGAILVREHTTVSDALDTLADAFPAHPLNLVNFGVLADEYRDYLERTA